MSLMVPPPTEEQLKDIIQGPSEVEWRLVAFAQFVAELYTPLLIAHIGLNILRIALISDLDAYRVCIRDAKEAFSVKPRFPDHFIYLVLDVQDNEEQNLIGAKQFIDEAISSGGRVLVHCNGGISLSPAFVVMYVMQYYQMSWEDALHTVQNRRYCISPNGGFLTQIKEYESIYRANVAVMTHPGRIVSVSRRKRTEDSDEEDIRDDVRKRAIRPLRGMNGVAVASPVSPTPTYYTERDPDAMET
ncbi:phosphatases II [Sanghuangporus baumii]|uniref:Phosphatases II n=1 Tax=Sanghuangporus baumii TaxID=108892 RepID=A0A9Q5N930_SANBA|nr:phosphatases II [Sanghuangporus baumii]